MRGKQWPEIELSSDKTGLKAGEPVVVRWCVNGADEATLWKSASLPDAPEPLDWMQIFRRGEKVELKGQMELSPATTIACYLVARGLRGISGRRIIIDVAMELDKPKEPALAWQPAQTTIGLMAEHSHVAWIGDRSWLARPRGGGEISTLPVIEMWRSDEVVFVDQTLTLSWNIQFANCAERGVDGSHTEMIADTTQISGTRITGGSMWHEDPAACSLELSGSAQEAHTWPGNYHWWIMAHDPLGQTNSSSVWADVLPVPQFTNAAADGTPIPDPPDSSRVTSIMNALKEIDSRLRNGCLANNPSLDASVAAFADGHIDRREFSSRLLAELQNLNLLRFCIQDVPDDQWGAGNWLDYRNDIFIQWSPTYTPWLEYVILHELVHKCGFNGGLISYYTHPQIEQQAHAVAKACFP